MKDSIVIYTNEKVLLHKQDRLVGDTDKSGNGEYFWEFFGRPPKDIKSITKVYFAVKGKVLGYFVVHEAWEDVIEWKSSTWTPLINPIPCKPFRGFRYVWW